MNEKELLKAGFDKVSGPTTRGRLILDVFGADKTGKTHFAFTAPGPIGYQSFDFGEEGVVDKFSASKAIYSKSYQRRIPDDVAKEKLDDVKKYALAVVKQFDEDMDLLLKAGARTLIGDTYTEYAEMLRLAHFGKLEKVPSHFYGAVNSWFQDTVRKANISGSNLIMIHRAKDEWEDYFDVQTGKDKSRKTGRKIRQGNETVPYLIQASVNTYKVPAKVDRQGNVTKPASFGVEVVTCRHNSDLEGQRFDDVDFPTLANIIVPELPVETWL